MTSSHRTESDTAALGIARFRIVPQRDGRFQWELINRHGTPIVHSMERFDNEGEAVAHAEYIRRLVGQAPIQRAGAE
jgi:hypothetical protein